MPEASHVPTPHSATDTCPICGTRGTVPFTGRTGHYEVVVCPTCGLGRTVPQPPDTVLEALYKGEYTSMDARKFGGPIEIVRRFFVRALARRIARRFGARGRVLDVGCGDGKLLVALAAHGFDGTGVELHSRVSERLPPGSDIRVFVGTLEQAAFPAASFRVVVLRHVLEHVHDPLATLTEVRRVIARRRSRDRVPNLASWQARARRDAWFTSISPATSSTSRPRPSPAPSNAPAFASRASRTSPSSRTRMDGCRAPSTKPGDAGARSTTKSAPTARRTRSRPARS
jgi:SAM-dependent methyltransferase